MASLETRLDEPRYEDIFHRNIGVLTPDAQELLRSSRVAIAGMGGPGGMVAEALVRMGLGRLNIADFDVYEAHNMNRQIGALVSTLGKEKTGVMEARLRGINPGLELAVYDEGVTVDNAAAFVEGTRAIVDTIDYFQPEARLALHREARKERRYVFAPPASGFGSLLLCFGPDSPPVEDFFEYPEQLEDISSHRIPHAKLTGVEMRYLPSIFYDTFRQDPPHVSTNGAATMMAGGAIAIQILKALMYEERRRDPSRFREYGEIDMVTLPRALRVDGWGAEYCREVRFG